MIRKIWHPTTGSYNESDHTLRCIAARRHPSATTGTHVAALLPLGGEAFDNGGMDQIAARVAGIPGITRVIIYQFTDTQSAAAAISADPPNVKEVVIGFSCGANHSPDVAALTRHRIDLVAVIQVSEWCDGSALGANVRRAQETYNPNCADTGGLGCGRLTPGPGFDPGNLIFIERPDCHTCSDHDLDAVSDIVLAVEAVVSPAAARRLTTRLGVGVPAAVRIITRHHGQRAY